MKKQNTRKVNKSKASCKISVLNRDPKKLTKEQKIEARILIIKDVLATIKLRKIIPSEGYYVNLDNVRSYTNTKGELMSSKQFQKTVKTVLNKRRSCNACALGSIFLTTVAKKNNFVPKFQNYIERSDIVGYLTDYFSKEQLDLIEGYFEGYFPECSKSINSRTHHMNMSGIEKYSAKDRLKIICENIIRNKGYFKPLKGFNQEFLLLETTP